MNGKGDKQRPCDKFVYDANYDHIFRKYVMDDTEHYELDEDAEPVMLDQCTFRLPGFAGDSHG